MPVNFYVRPHKKFQRGKHRRRLTAQDLIHHFRQRSTFVKIRIFAHDTKRSAQSLARRPGTGGHFPHLHRCWRYPPLALCGHSGCCDNSPGRHATAHFHATGHPIIRSYEPGEDWWWCYVDDVAFEIEGAPPSPSHG